MSDPSRPAPRPSMAVPAGPAVDKAAIKQLRQFGDDLVQKVVATFLETSPARIANVRAAFVGSDAARLETEAHTLKSSCGQLGARRMEELCEFIEQCGHNRRVDDAALTVPKLEAEFVRVKEELSKPIL